MAVQIARTILTQAQRDAIVDAYASGRLSPDIAREYRVSAAFVRSIASRAGKAKRPVEEPKLPAWTAEEIETIAGMMRGNATAADIGRRFGMSRQTVHKRVEAIPALKAIGFVNRSQIMRRSSPRKALALVETAAIVDLDVEPADIVSRTGCRHIVNDRVGVDSLYCNREFHLGTSWCRHHYALVFTPESQRRAA